MNKGNTVNKPLHEILAKRSGVFLLVFFVIMLISYGFLYAIDFIPEPVTEEAEGSESSYKPSQTVQDQENATDSDAVSSDSIFPQKIVIDALDREVDVLNPNSRSVEVLDQALLDGVVRHPDSAHFGETGNMFILGHSSYLPNVFNKNFQAFNGLQTLSWGDTIRVFSKDTEYIYRVERVYEAKASEVVVPNSRGEGKLTLATCNTFGAKEDRFIVEANLVSKKVI